MKRKGQLAIFFAFFVFAIIIILMAAVLSPMATRFTTESILAGEMILESTQERALDINDTEIRNSVNASIQGALDNAEDNITINTAIFKYMWVLVVSLGCLIMFLITRSLVEFGKSSGGII